MRILAMGLVVFSLLACGDDEPTPGTDSGGTDGGTDTTAPADSGTDSSTDSVGTDSATDVGADAMADVPIDGGAGCGTERAPVERISGTEGLAIAPDGTLYFSQSGGVGRRVPGSDPEPRWITGLGGTVWGLAYRDTDDVLFVASPSMGRGTIFRIDTTAEVPTAEPMLTGVGQPNGLIVADDGSILYSDFGGGRVYRADDAATVTRVNDDASIEQPNGLFIDDDGTLLVLSYGPGEVLRLTIDAGWQETGREVAATIRARPDGIARDTTGRYYVTDNGAGRLLRFDSDFGSPMALVEGAPAAANVAFGRGALDCTDIYVTSSGPMRVVNAGEMGRP